MSNVNSIMKNVKSWVKEVGKFQIDNLGKQNLLVDIKSTGIDLVTEIDKKSEDYLLKKIEEYYPQHSILSEESGKKSMDSDYLWIIDPLDGTTNFAQGLPIFSISVALQYKEETILGAIYVPRLDLMFEAIIDEKAFLNGKEIKVGVKKDLKECVLATGFPYDREKNPDNNINYFSRFIPQVRGIRRLGSAAYDLANVACGVWDGYWELNLSIWDIAAGELIVKEAGGKIIYLPEKRGQSLIAGNNEICEVVFREMEMLDNKRISKDQ